jgi:hypothetical protein
MSDPNVSPELSEEVIALKEGRSYDTVDVGAPTGVRDTGNTLTTAVRRAGREAFDSEEARTATPPKTRRRAIAADRRRRAQALKRENAAAKSELSRRTDPADILERVKVSDAQSAKQRDAQIVAERKREAEAEEQVAAAEAELSGIDPAQVELEFAEAKASAEQDEAQTLEAVRTICSGRIPQNPVLIKARVDPAACFGDWYQPGRAYPAEYSACPAMVPVFTTACGVKHMRETAGGMNANGKRNRSAGGETILPVVAHIPSFARIQTLGCNFHANDETDDERARDGEDSMKLFFVGVSYGAVSKTSLVTVSSGGQMPVPHEYDRANFFNLLGCRVRWARSTKRYGEIPGFHIAVPVTEDDYSSQADAKRLVNKENDDLFEDVNDKAACRMVVQQATMFDCAILLGT